MYESHKVFAAQHCKTVEFQNSGTDRSWKIKKGTEEGKLSENTNPLALAQTQMKSSWFQKPNALIVTGETQTQIQIQIQTQVF